MTKTTEYISIEERLVLASVPACFSIYFFKYFISAECFYVNPVSKGDLDRTADGYRNVSLPPLLQKTFR